MSSYGRMIQEQLIEAAQSVVKMRSGMANPLDVHKAACKAMKARLTFRFSKFDVNEDAIDISFRIETQGVQSKYELVYGNLYTFVLCDGLCVPYYKWIFTDNFWDKKSNVVYVKEGDKYFKRTFSGNRMNNLLPGIPDFGVNIHATKYIRSHHTTGRAIDMIIKEWSAGTQSI